MKVKNSIKSSIAVAITAATLFSSCNQQTSNKTSENHAITDTTIHDSITVNPLTHAKDFPGANLAISAITSEKLGNDSAKVTIKYTVKNFNLTEQTDHDHHMANSADGQHIHFILDNTAYTALYKPEHTVTLPINSEHYLLIFLSRSFHESIKTKEASKLIKFKIDANGNVEELPSPTEASVFYSRPKGEYKGEDIKSVLLDFFLVNTELNINGNKVIANINGKDFTLDSWSPYEIKNLPLGQNTIKLSLVDKDGKALTGDNVSVERTITLSDK